MPNPIEKLEDRVARVEEKLAKLESVLDSRQPWYRQIVGSFAGGKAYAEIIRIGRQIRRGKRQM